MTYLRLNGGAIVRVPMTVEDLEDALQDALERGTMLKLRSSDGRRVLINPTHIVYVEERTEATAAEGPDALTSRDLEATPAG
jgi:Protein of unknown function (DUF3107)